VGSARPLAPPTAPPTSDDAATPAEVSLDDVAAPDVSLDDVAAAATVEAHATEDQQFGRPGRQINRQAPFIIGFTATFGVAAAFVLLWAVYSARGLLTEIGLGLFIALGLDPLVTWLQRRRVPRSAAVLLVVLGALAVLTGIALEIVPVVATQITNLVHDLPQYERSLSSHSSTIGKLNTRYNLINRIQAYITSHQSTLAGGVIGVGKAVISGVLETLIVTVVSIYFLADMPRVKRTVYQLAPRSRRARVVLLGDEIFAKVGGYVLGNVLVSVIAGVSTWIWALVFGIPYPLLLAIVVAVLDLVPLVGSTVGGVIVALVALTVSLPLAVATVAFYLIFRLLEDYLLTPRIMGATIEVPGIVTVIATLLGGALLGIVGALIAIPIAAAVNLLVREVTVPTMNRR
jgi:predicted PurR-regulated permease PerM